MAFKQVSTQISFPDLEKEILKRWYENGIVSKYLTKNADSKKKYSFLDGPITANNPMGVHHAWGRTYKDLWQRYYTMQGFRQRYQNGFDCQGLWVEVEVEKELGFKSKKDIEVYGVANFVNKCKERVLKYSSIQTEQSKRLGYFMDWDNSYFTMADENNYTIWNFLSKCWNKGWIYKGHDVVPWCPRCETAISQHEILTEDYKELTHESVFLKFPITGKQNEFLLIWTTTPWTLIANTAVAVDAKLEYSLVELENGHKLWVASALVDQVFKNLTHKILETSKGEKLTGLHYSSPFDDIPAVAEALKTYPEKYHIVVATDDMIMPISVAEGTGLVHTSTSTGEEDHQLGKKLGLPVVPAIDDTANYLEGFGQFSKLNAKKNPKLIIDYLYQASPGEGYWVHAIVPYTHRYPACWRCKTELVWKVADEWYIAMDTLDPEHPDKKTFRQQMQDVVSDIHWMPEFGLERELDWLKNMHDWLISKKNRYWGLALPIYDCLECGNFEVVSGKEELKSRAVSGWDRFDGNSPHKPWIDEVKIACSKCGKPVSRIPDVGNPWLDAGIVSISTMSSEWFPADFITESFPGQFKNWFYSLIAMGTVMKSGKPFKNVLGYASLLAEDGKPMHKSWGNSIEFNEGADKIGVDVMRWMYVNQNPESNMLFGYKKADESRRQFHLMLWNIFNFFITYANLDGFDHKNKLKVIPSTLDNWILARLTELTIGVSKNLEAYDAASCGVAISDFVNDLSLWYVRRSRDRVGPTAKADEKLPFYQTMYYVLTVLSQIMAPFMPYISEEIYTTLTSAESVHLSEWPKLPELTKQQQTLIADMKYARKLVEVALSKRKESGIKVRQPLSLLTVKSPMPVLSEGILQLVMDEVNIKKIAWEKNTELSVELDTVISKELQAEGQVRELIRQIQEARKNAGARLDQKIRLLAPLPLDASLVEEIKRKTLAQEVQSAEVVSIELL